MAPGQKEGGDGSGGGVDAGGPLATAMGPCRQSESGETGTSASLSTTISPKEGASGVDGGALPLRMKQGGLRCGALCYPAGYGSPPETTGVGETYTIFSDSTAAIERLRTDRPGPVQALAEAIIYFERPALPI